MIQVVIINRDGKTVSPTDLATVADLQAAAEQARNLLRDCERIAKLKDPKAPAAPRGQVPYLT